MNFDNIFISQYPQTSYREGKFAKVPILLGTNTDEGTSFGTTGTNTDEDCIAQLTCEFYLLPQSHPCDQANAFLYRHSFQALGSYPQRGHQTADILPQRPSPGLPLRLGQCNLAKAGA